MSTLSSWSSGQPWSFDSMGIPRSLTAPQPPNILPPIAYSMASQRRHQNSSGSSGLGSTSDEITYPQISKGYFKAIFCSIINVNIPENTPKNLNL